MFSKKLEDLIQAALQDGVLTEQEKAAIMKRAQEEGEDKDEVEIYIQSLIQKKTQEQEELPMWVESMISEIIEASNKMEVEDGEILFHSDYKEIDKDLYDKLMRQGEGEWLKYNKYDNSYKYDKKYDYYFTMMNKLDTLYGDIPKVRKFITEQKKKELEALSNAFLNNIDSYKKESSSKRKVLEISEAEKCLNTIKKSYGTMPESQSLISEYQNKIEKIKSSLGYKFAYIGNKLS